MYISNQLPYLADAHFDGSCANSIGQTYWYGLNKEQASYQGMSVQMLEPPFPAYINQPDICQNTPESLSLWNTIDILSQTHAILSAPYGTNIHNRQQSILNEHCFEHFYEHCFEHCSYDVLMEPVVDDNYTITSITAVNPQQIIGKYSPGLAPVTFSSQPSSRSVSIPALMNQNMQQRFQTENAGTVATNRINIVKSLKRPLSACAGFAPMPQECKKNRFSTTSENRVGTGDFTLPIYSGCSKGASSTITIGKITYKAYHDKLRELVPSFIFDQAEAAGLAAAAVQATDKQDYKRAYRKAYNDKMKDLFTPDLPGQAKAAGQKAGKAAEKKAQRKAYQNAYNRILIALVPSEIFGLAKAASQRADKKFFRQAYNKDYHSSYSDKLNELVSPEIFDQAKAAGQVAGRAAGRAASRAARKGSYGIGYYRAYHLAHNGKLRELVSSNIFDQARAAAKAAGQDAKAKAVQAREAFDTYLSDFHHPLVTI